ncbi:class II aldolase/adducin family protein [Calditrichota bacterium]
MLKDEILNSLIKAGKRLDLKNLIAGTEGNPVTSALVGTEGNLSVRLSQSEILITATNSNKGELSNDDFVLLDPTGKILAGKKKPSSELQAHLIAYKHRADIGAVIHAHPPNVIALTIAGIKLEAVPLAEAAYLFGSVPTCDFFVPGAGQGSEVIGRWIACRDAVIFDHHGAMTVGHTIDEALIRMEMLEAVAHTVFLYSQLGAAAKLDSETADAIVSTALEAGYTTIDAIKTWGNLVTGP